MDRMECAPVKRKKRRGKRRWRMRTGGIRNEL